MYGGAAGVPECLLGVILYTSCCSTACRSAIASQRQLDDCPEERMSALQDSPASVPLLRPAAAEEPQEGPQELTCTIRSRSVLVQGQILHIVNCGQEGPQYK